VGVVDRKSISKRFMDPNPNGIQTPWTQHKRQILSLF